MNWKRGLSRLWLAVSALWLIIVTVFSYGQIVSPDIQPHTYVLVNANSDFYEFNIFYDTGFQLPPDFKLAEQTRIDFPNNVILFAGNDIPKDVLKTRSESFYEQYVKPRDAEATTARWLSLGRATALGLLPPLALILLGLVIGWIASGFKSTVQKS